MSSYPRETDEFQPIEVRVKGVLVTTGVEVAVIQTGLRPLLSDWKTPEVVDSGLAIRVDELEPRSWNVWARVTTVSETVVVYCGNFRVT